MIHASTDGADSLTAIEPTGLEGKNTMALRWTGIRPWLLIASLLASPARGQDFLGSAKRVVCLGDSITYSGEYLAMLETALRLEFPEREIELLNLGLPSETVSGLSEPGHAGGQFPRPSIHERLDRVLKQTNPELVIACYGMNCGIYHPYSDERFDAYRQGIRRLHEKIAANGAKLILLTPPPFDPLPILAQTLPAGAVEYAQPYRDYDQVLGLYAAWLIAAQGEGWRVIDLHGPINAFIAQRRLADPTFGLAPDGIHLNPQGHWLMARELIRELGPGQIDTTTDSFEDSISAHGLPQPVSDRHLLERIHQRQKVLRDAYLTLTGHQRPGIPVGLPLAEAHQQADMLSHEIQKMTKSRNSTAR
jgi:lysophospholipase L1-like esterase